MEPQEVIGVYILGTRCGKCQYITYVGTSIWLRFICTRRWIPLPTLANQTFACECPYFKRYEYHITMSDVVLSKLKKEGIEKWRHRVTST